MKKSKKAIKKREEGFCSNVKSQKVSKYSALGDSNLKHYFESRRLQHHLHATGMIDDSGRILDTERHKGKIAIIEQEFKNAEIAEKRRMREEASMRKLVQAKRHAALNDARREQRLKQMKEDRVIRQEIVRAAKSYSNVNLKPN